MMRNVFEIEQQMLDRMAASDRQARLAWMLHDRFARQPARRRILARAIGSILVTLGGWLETLGWALDPGTVAGG